MVAGRKDQTRNPHDPDLGTRFGAVVVTVSPDMGDCVLHVDAATGRPRFTPRFHSLEEIEGAIMAQQVRATADPVAGDMVRALRFAAKWIAPRQAQANREG